MTKIKMCTDTPTTMQSDQVDLPQDEDIALSRFDSVLSTIGHGDPYDSDSSEFSISSVSSYDYSSSDSLSDTELSQASALDLAKAKPRAERGRATALRSFGVAHDFDAKSILFSSALQKTAERYKTVISLRLPSSLGQSYIDAGYPTKNFHVKAKSSDKGPTAGLIAFEPSLSKRAPEQYQKQAEDIQKALNLGAKLVDLELTESKIAALLADNLMEQLPDGRFRATYHGNEAFFTIINGKVFHQAGELDGQPVKVLTNPPEKKTKRALLPTPASALPITADYDLFSIIPNKNHAINPRPLRVGQRTVRKPSVDEETVFPEKLKRDYGTMKRSKAFATALRSFTQVKGKPEEMDPNQGNFHRFGMTIVESINKFAQKEGYTGGKLVWHGDEAGNPANAGFIAEDAPVFFIPGYAPVQVKTRDELVALHNKLIELDYQPEDVPW